MEIKDKDSTGPQKCPVCLRSAKEVVDDCIKNQRTACVNNACPIQDIVKNLLIARRRKFVIGQPMQKEFKIGEPQKRVSKFKIVSSSKKRGQINNLNLDNGNTSR